MKAMKLQMHSIHFDADTKLLAFIERKVNKLEKYYSRVVDGEVIMRLNNRGTDNKTVEIKINIPGDQLFARERSNTFETATDTAVDALKRQIKKFKEKRLSH